MSVREAVVVDVAQEAGAVRVKEEGDLWHASVRRRGVLPLVIASVQDAVGAVCPGSGPDRAVQRRCWRGDGAGAKAKAPGDDVAIVARVGVRNTGGEVLRQEAPP